MGSGKKFEPVQCVLQQTLNVGSAGHHYIGWSAIYNNPVEWSPLSEIPSGLGLSFSLDGVPSGFTVEEDGTWAFSFSSSIQVDANYKGWLSPALVGSSSYVTAGSSPMTAISVTAKLLAGYSFSPEIVTATAAAAGPSFSAVVRAVIVRLA